MAIPSFFFFFIMLFMVFCFGKAQIESEKAALLAFKSSTGKSLHWSERNSTCSWSGIVCEQGRVVVLRLPRAGLTGSLPKDTIGNLTKLRTLDLSFNDLNGQIPEDISKCAGLENVLFQGNHLSGDIPSTIFQLRNLVRLNLAANKFTGNISPHFENLTNLNTLYLENNQLNGSLPNLSFSNLLQLNVSYNPLMGEVPENLKKFGQTAFLGTSLCLEGFCVTYSIPPPPIIQSTSTQTPPSRTTRKTKKKKAVIGGVTGSVTGVICLAIAAVIYIIAVYADKRKKNAQAKISDIEIAEDDKHSLVTEETPKP